MRAGHLPHLANGMAIDAEVEAHLLGMRILELKAAITVLPAARPVAFTPPRAGPTVRKARRAQPGAVHPGAAPGASSNGALADAAHTLASVAADLRAARGQQPAP